MARGFFSIVGGATRAWVEEQFAANPIANVVEDTTPQLGGDLDVNGHLIQAIVQLNKNSIDSDLVIPEGYNTLSIGPLDINAEITINKNSTWEIT